MLHRIAESTLPTLCTLQQSSKYHRSIPAPLGVPPASKLNLLIQKTTISNPVRIKPAEAWEMHWEWKNYVGDSEWEKVPCASSGRRLRAVHSFPRPLGRPSLTASFAEVGGSRRCRQVAESVGKNKQTKTRNLNLSFRVQGALGDLTRTVSVSRRDLASLWSDAGRWINNRR